MINKPILEVADRIISLTNAQNLLRSPEHHFSFLDILRGHNKNGEPAAGGDLVFEYEKPMFGLNDRVSTQTVTVPRETILNKDLTAT